MFNWDDYLQLAEELHEQEDSNPQEAEERSAISRAYYAAFHDALQYAPARIQETRSKKHQKLIDYYEGRRTQEEQEVGRLLESLRDNRNAADYDTDIGGPGQCVYKANASIHLSKKIMAKLSDLY